MRTARRVFRNAMVLLGADLVRVALGLALTIVVARRLGSGELGKLSYMLVMVGILAVITDFGLSPYYIRIAQQDGGRSTAGAVLMLRLLAAGICAVGLALYAMTPADASVRVLLWLGSLMLVINVVPSWLAAVLRAREQMVIESVTKIVSSLLTTVGGIAVLWLGHGVIEVAGVMVLVALGMLGYFAWLGSRLAPRPLGLVRPPVAYLQILRGAWPFASLSILVSIYFRIDSVMLFSIRGQAALGQYSAAYRMMEAALLVPWMLSAAALPPVARYLAARSDEVIRESLRALHFLLGLAIPAAVLGAVLAAPLFALFYGPAFAEAAQIFRWLAFTLIAVFASSVTSTLISGSPRPMVNTLIALVMVVLNVSLNLVLIPRWSGTGAAVATLVTEATGLALGTLYIRRALAPLPYVGHALKPILGALVAAAAAWLYPSLMMIPVCVTLYLAVLWGIGGITAEDVAYVKALVLRRAPAWQTDGDP